MRGSGCDDVWWWFPLVVVVSGCVVTDSLPLPAFSLPGFSPGVFSPIASIKSFPADAACLDDNGATRSVGESWAHACDWNYCHGGTIQNHTLMYRCRPIGPGEIRDTINCREEATPFWPFPVCCPVISCDQRNVSVTPAPPACSDLSPDSACDIWKVELGGCSPTSPFYNITSIYCRLTCGFC